MYYLHKPELSVRSSLSDVFISVKAYIFSNLHLYSTFYHMKEYAPARVMITY